MGFSHQEAPQAHGQEEAPQAAQEDPHPAQEQEVTTPWSGAQPSRVSGTIGVNVCSVLVGFAGVLVAAVATGMLARRLLSAGLGLAASPGGREPGPGGRARGAEQGLCQRLRSGYVPDDPANRASAGAALAGLGPGRASGGEQRRPLRHAADIRRADRGGRGDPGHRPAQRDGRSSQAWPLTSVHFQPIARSALDVVQAVAVLVALACVGLVLAGRGLKPPLAAVLPPGPRRAHDGRVALPAPRPGGVSAAQHGGSGADRVRCQPGRRATQSGRPPPNVGAQPRGGGRPESRRGQLLAGLADDLRQADLRQADLRQRGGRSQAGEQVS